MSERSELTENIRVLRSFLSEASVRYGLTPFQSGFSWIIGYILLSLFIARLIFWYHSWNFSWMPAGLASIFALFFLVVHIVVGPSCILFCNVVQEIRKALCHGSRLPLRSPFKLMKEFVKTHFTAEYLLNGALAYCLVYGTLIGYTNLKPAIPLLNNNLYDAILSRWDANIFNVLSLGDQLTIPKLTTFTVFFDNIYFHMWTLACITLVVSFRARAVYWQFTAAWCLAFGLSIPISVLFPSLGPAFYRPQHFAHIGNTLSVSVMNSLWSHYLSFKADPYNFEIVRANGIMAMPSLHIALVFLSVITLGKILPRLKLLLGVFLILYMMSTVYLGWHYLSDGIAGILLGWLTYRVSTLWFHQEEQLCASGSRK